MAWDWRADLAVNSPKRGAWGAVRAFVMDPSFACVAWIRLLMNLKSRRFPLAGTLASLVYAHIVKTFSVEIVFNVRRIGKGLRLVHPFGIAIGADAEIGDYVTIMQNVTIGTRYLVPIAGSSNAGAPRPVGKLVIGDGASICAGAVVLGPLTVGEGAVVGANAVVLDDVPAHATVVGSPARRILPKTRPNGYGV